MRNSLLYTVLLLLLAGCVEPFVLEDTGFQEQLVVEGLITDGPGPYTVQLSTSNSIEKVIFRPKDGCEVYVHDLSGNTYKFHESEIGMYQSDSSQFRGKVGESYQLEVKTPEGENYRSTWQRIEPATGIKEIRAERSAVSDPNSARERNGLQFYVQPEPTDRDTLRYLWQVDATYEYRADYKIDFYYDGEEHVFPNRDSLYVCYRTFRVPQIYIYSTAQQIASTVPEIPLHFQDTRSRALTYLYSILVHQLSINEETYEYWSDLNELIELQGQVFDKQPFQVNGNVSISDNDTEKALGFFMAAGITSKREFFEWSYGQFEYGTCAITEAEIRLYGDLRFFDPSAYPIYIVSDPQLTVKAVLEPSCMDCRKFGGVLDKPSFWP